VTDGGGQKYNNKRGFTPRNRENFGRGREIGTFGRGRGIGNFGRGGKGPIICYNCNKTEKLSYDYLNPCTMCI
jgi:hypothetical protein